MARVPLLAQGRRLSGTRPVTGDKRTGMLDVLAKVFPEARHQRCTVHFYRNILGRVPMIRRKEVGRIPEAIHAQESREACERKTAEVAASLDEMHLGAAAGVVCDGVAETLAYTGFPPEHWRESGLKTGSSG